MGTYLILGAGKFGRLALERLAEEDPAAGFLVVDQDPEALAVTRTGATPAVQWVEAEAIDFLIRHLGKSEPWDWIIPMVPVHVAAAWLLAGPLADTRWQTVEPPEALLGLAPTVQRGAQGEIYLSRARHLCPEDCAEPATVCPVTGESREQPLHEELASLTMAGHQIMVVPSTQLVPGVGGYPPWRLLKLARDLKPLPERILVATACRCHGVVHGLACQPGAEGV